MRIDETSNNGGLLNHLNQSCQDDEPMEDPSLQYSDVNDPSLQGIVYKRFKLGNNNPGANINQSVQSYHIKSSGAPSIKLEANTSLYQ